MERKRRYKLLNRHAIGGIFAICIVFLIHKRIRQFLYVTWITIATTNNVNGQATIDSSETFRYQQLIAPATLITLGSIGVNNTFICHLKHEIKDEFSDLRGDSRFHADDYIQYVPFATGLGLNLTGIPARHDLKGAYGNYRYGMANDGYHSKCDKTHGERTAARQRGTELLPLGAYGNGFHGSRDCKERIWPQLWRSGLCFGVGCGFSADI